MKPLTDELINKETTKRMLRYEAMINRDTLDQEGIDFAKSPAEVLRFFMNCRAVARQAGNRMVREGATKVIPLMGAAAFQAVSLAVLIEELEKRGEL
jgi:hypothetical protein